MEAITYRARQVPSGIRGLLSLEARELEKELGEFLRELHRYEKGRQEREPDYELELEVTLRRWYRRRTTPANNLQWELCKRLAAADHVSKDLIHAAVRELHYPRVEYRGTFVAKPGPELTTVEFAKVIEALVVECNMHEPPVEIRDIWVLFTDWRFGQERDPLEGTYASKEDYKEKHPCCEAHGKVLVYTDKEGVQRNAGEVAHIVSVGSGGSDADWNWLLLCPDCHRGLQHGAGWDAFLQQHVHLRAKVERARARAGKAPIETRAATPVPAESTPAAPVDAVVDAVAQAKLVQRVFQGTVVEGNALMDPPRDKDPKQLDMLAKLQALAQDAEAKQEKYYGKSKPAAVAGEELDFKAAQYKDQEEIY